MRSACEHNMALDSALHNSTRPQNLKYNSSFGFGFRFGLNSLRHAAAITADLVCRRYGTVQPERTRSVLYSVQYSTVLERKKGAIKNSEARCNA